MPTINRRVTREKPVHYKRDNRSSKYYNSQLWHNLRAYYIRRHPLCEECLSKDIIKPAQHVHHLQPFLTGVTVEDKWKLLLDEDNLMSLCIACHHEKHKQREER